MSITDHSEQLVKDAPVFRATLKPGDNKLSWVLWPGFTARRGTLNVIVKTWDMYPSEDAHCLGVDGVTFTYQ
jgi:hypothetical protein